MERNEVAIDGSFYKLIPLVTFSEARGAGKKATARANKFLGWKKKLNPS